uniref:Uncharacterized protein n=1 Tax=viral metagenome TaxID=1070528 RepID=A0A6C0BZC9_9ZZZZ
MESSYCNDFYKCPDDHIEGANKITGCLKKDNPQ